MLPYPDDLMWLALTVYMEASGEPYEGKLAVAGVICRRAKAGGVSVSDTVLRKFQFSAWNTDSPTRLLLDSIDPKGGSWTDCYKASAAAYFTLSPDPTSGATHYLNEEVVKKVAGKLPAWYDERKVTARIGRHTFLDLTKKVD